MSITHIAFYPSDWLAGTRGLTAEETGVYITLICRMYEMAGAIERDDDRLFRLCGCRSKKSFVKTLDYLIAEGKIEQRENSLFNERTQKEIKKTVEKSSKASDAAHSRWSRKSNKINGTTHANASQTHMLQRCQPEPEPEPEDIDEVSISNNVRFPTLFCEPDFENFWKAFPSGRKRGKGKCREIFKRLVIKTGVDPNVLIEAARSGNGIDPSYPPMPATWLNQGRWEDEPQGTLSKPSKRNEANQALAEWIQDDDRSQETDQHSTQLLPVGE